MRPVPATALLPAQAPSSAQRVPTAELPLQRPVSPPVPPTQPLQRVRAVCGQPAAGGPCHLSSGHGPTCLAAPRRSVWTVR